MLSHGFLDNSINKKFVNNILEKITKEYSSDISQGNTYFDNIHIKIPLVKNLINKKIEKKINLLLKTQSISLEQVETGTVRPLLCHGISVRLCVDFLLRTMNTPYLILKTQIHI